MYCMNCGKKLPEGAKFCAYCGTRQILPEDDTPVSDPDDDTSWLYEDPPEFDDLFPSPDVPRSAYGAYGCSEKQGNMVYVPEKGIFLIYEKTNICFVPEDGGKPRFITRKSKNYVELDGLNYYNGKLYYWRYTEGGGDCGTSLVEMDVSTFEKKEVKLTDPVSPALNNQERFPVVNGVMYLLRSPGNDRNCLCAIELDTGKVSCKALPDLRTKTMPEDWRNLLNNLGHSLDADKVNYGFTYLGFAALGGYGYVGRTAFPEFVVRFRLSDPSDFEYMPLNSCSVLRELWGTMIAECQGGLLGIGVGAGPGLQSYRLQKINLRDNRISGSRGLLDMKKYGQHRESWWKLSENIFFIGNLKINLFENNANRMNFSIAAKDFAPRGDGRTYVYDGERVYLLPAGFWTQVACEDDLKKFVIAEF